MRKVGEQHVVALRHICGVDPYLYTQAFDGTEGCFCAPNLDTSTVDGLKVGDIVVIEWTNLEIEYPYAKVIAKLV